MINTIELFPDGRIGCYEMPAKTYKIWSIDESLNALEAAKRDVVYFKPNDEGIVLFHLRTLIGQVEQGKPYPVPDGYDVKLNYSCRKCGDSDELRKCSNPFCVDRKYAILVKSDTNA